MKLTLVTAKQSTPVSKLSSDKRKRSVRNCDCEKNEITKHCWEPNRLSISYP